MSATSAKVEGPCTRGEEGEKPTWSDCVSSVHVVSGWTATLYRDREYKGSSVTLTADSPNLTRAARPVRRQLQRLRVVDQGIEAVAANRRKKLVGFHCGRAG